MAQAGEYWLEKLQDLPESEFTEENWKNPHHLLHRFSEGQLRHEAERREQQSKAEASADRRRKMEAAEWGDMPPLPPRLPPPVSTKMEWKAREFYKTCRCGTAEQMQDYLESSGVDDTIK
jgi:hypothetical protein